MRRFAFTVVVVMSLLLGLFPAAATPTASSGPAHSNNIRHVKNIPYAPYAEGKTPNFGTDMEFATLRVAGERRRYAFAGSYQNGLQILDVTNPARTRKVAVYDCGVLQGDVQVFRQGSRTFVTYTSEDTTSIRPESRCVRELAPGAATDKRKGYGTYIVEVTNPARPRSAGFIPVIEGSHNGTVHPSGKYFYNSNSSLYHNTVEDGGPGIEIYSIADVTKPRRLMRLPLPVRPFSLGTESHDITFNGSGTRAYSAALSQGVILDTTNPAKPKIITSFVDPTINVWHQSDPITVGKRTFLVVEDEVAGALPTGQCPNGGVHIFDITGARERKPVKVGYWNIDEARVTGADGGPVDGTCTAHVFDLHPRSGLMTIAYYNGGVRIVDLNGLEGVSLGGRTVSGKDPMKQLAYFRFPDSDAWSAKTPRINADRSMYLFGNDIARGMDVFYFNGKASKAAAAQGRWMTATETSTELRTSAELGQYRPLCLLPGE